VRHFLLASTLLYVLSLSFGQPGYCQQPDLQPIVLRAEIPALAPVNDLRQAGSDRTHNVPPPAVPYRVAQARPPAIPPQIEPQTASEAPAMATLGTLRTSLANSDVPADSGSANLRPMLSPTQPGASSTPTPAAGSPVSPAAEPPPDSPTAVPAIPTPGPSTTSKGPATPSSEPPRRAPPDPLDSVFAMTNYPGGPLIGVPDTDPVWPLESIIYKACPLLKKYRIKIYGWVDPSYNASTSKHSNVPLSYNIVPNRLELSQLVGRIERQPDTVQTEHMDWGFRATPLFGIDYRYIAAAGWQPAASELLQHNDLYGFDYPELYGMVYIPKVAQGMIVKVGRYISPPDIEAQLSPDNFLYTHSIMFTYDAYTHTGIQNTVKLNDQWMVQAGLHAGTDNSPWTRSAHPSLEAFARWVSKNNKDSFYGGVDSVNGGSYKFQKDNIQQFNLTYSHKFNNRLNTMTEGYYLYTFDALKGGTVSNGPVKGFGGGGGPGAPLPGYSNAFGIVNYTNLKITNRDYITFRPIDYLFDPQGWRTGFANTMASWTVGWCHRFSDLLCIRPEVRYERSVGGRQPNAWDNGTKSWQFTFSCDIIQRF
jgi:Putative beta-barrel porin-2, OmpL-like. bbp2